MKFDCESVRFSLDIPDTSATADEEVRERGNASAQRHFLYSAIAIREETFPRIFGVLKTAFGNLGAEFSAFDFFVSASAEMQAFVFLESGAQPVFVLTSSLIERLNDTELAFVIGHEYGHFILRHRHVNPIDEDDFPLGAAYFQMLKRASEISADRVGLIACRDVKSALSSLIKIVSGLTQPNIRFSVNVFLRQFDELLARGSSHHERESSHPLFLLRLRSLIAFGRSKIFLQNSAPGATGTDKREVDLQVERDFKRLSGFSAEEISAALAREIGLYSAFSEFVKDGCYSKDEQNLARELFDENEVSEMLRFVKNRGRDAISEAAAVRRLFALRCALPASARERLENIEDSLRKLLKKNGHSQGEA